MRLPPRAVPVLLPTAATGFFRLRRLRSESASPYSAFLGFGGFGVNPHRRIRGSSGFGGFGVNPHRRIRLSSGFGGFGVNPHRRIRLSSGFGGFAAETDCPFGAKSLRRLPPGSKP